MGEIDINKLWQNFLDTVTNHYVDFDGRVGRAQFWYYVLVTFVLGLAVGIVASLTLHVLSTLFSLALLLPNLGMTVRRLHDTGKPGMWALLLAVPVCLAILFGLLAILGGALGFLALLLVFGSLIWLASLVALAVLIYFCAQPSMAGDNAYGPPPPVWTPGAATA